MAFVRFHDKTDEAKPRLFNTSLIESITPDSSGGSVILVTGDLESFYVVKEEFEEVVNILTTLAIALCNNGVNL